MERIAPIFAVRDLAAAMDFHQRMGIAVRAYRSAEWRSAGVEVHSPQDTEWEQHEGAVVDPDGNVIRLGSPIG